MRQSRDEKLEQYIHSLLADETASMKQSRDAASELGLAHISISPSEAKILQTLVAIHRCQFFVEVGTLTGLSAQYILAGMPKGSELWSLEKDPKHAALAKGIVAPVAKILGCQFHLVEGDARQTLNQLSRVGGFDGIFIDGNKAAYGDYLDWAESNIRPGGIIIADNVFLRGSVWGQDNPNFSHKQIQVMQNFNKRLLSENKYFSSVIPTAEGLLVAIKKS